MGFPAQSLTAKGTIIESIGFCVETEAPKRASKALPYYPSDTSVCRYDGGERRARTERQGAIAEHTRHEYYFSA